MAEKDSLPDFLDFSEKLKNEFNVILERCTMTGEAYTQLHNYLLPMQEMFEKLGSGSAGDCKAAVGMLQKHLDEYGKYFQ